MEPGDPLRDLAPRGAVVLGDEQQPVRGAERDETRRGVEPRAVDVVTEPVRETLHAAVELAAVERRSVDGTPPAVRPDGGGDEDGVPRDRDAPAIGRVEAVGAHLPRVAAIVAHGETACARSEGAPGDRQHSVNVRVDVDRRFPPLTGVVRPDDASDVDVDVDRVGVLGDGAGDGAHIWRPSPWRVPLAAALGILEALDAPKLVLATAVEKLQQVRLGGAHEHPGAGLSEAVGAQAVLDRPRVPDPPRVAVGPPDLPTVEDGPEDSALQRGGRDVAPLMVDPPLLAVRSEVEEAVVASDEDRRHASDAPTGFVCASCLLVLPLAIVRPFSSG